MTPEFQVSRALDIPDSFADPRRRQGFTALVSVPSGAIVTGQSALAGLGGLPRREAVIRQTVAMHINVKTPVESGSPPPAGNTPGQPGGRRRGPDSSANENPYPRSLMGAVAHLRQAMFDAAHFKNRADHFRDHGGTPPPFDPALDALRSVQGPTGLPAWWEANTRDEIHRALDLADEFHTSAVIVGGKEAVRVIDRLKAEKVPVILRLDFPEEPKVPSEEEYRKKSLAEREEPLSVLKERHRKWKEQVGAAAELAGAGIPFGFSTEGLEKAESFAAKLRAVIAAGLKADDALAALTSGAAKILDLDESLGTLEVGKLGHVVAFTAPFDDEKAKVRYVLVDGQKFEVKPPDRPAADSTGRDRRESGPDPRSAPRHRPSSPNSKPEAGKAEVQNASDPAKPIGSSREAKSPEPPGQRVDAKAESKRPEGEAKPKPPFVDVPAEFDTDRKPRLHTGGDVLIKDATILTVTKGTIARGAILILDGRIAAVGPDAAVPDDKAHDVTVINADGLVAMPGIIDTHSHIAIQGSVNEFSLSVVPEIRVKDVVTGDDVSIYRALAGGTTTARLLHGSANTIGGQDAIVKLRYGKPGRDLIIRDAPQGVKFALGENVTRSRGRFPNTRMGVQSVIERAFLEGRAYQERGRRREPGDPPPRRDLRLEALARILDGSIKIHSHCYRADEILMLLDTAERFGVRVQSLQHVLEGYKVAAEIAAHGASASTFSDWWGYKVEAFDAIPQNAAILGQAGVNVCIKSDSEELVRHLNLEAAKMVKYGGVAESTALAMITINPARELGLEDRLGSIEVGKDGDIAIFNGHPFDAFSRCELALIDGEVYFERREPAHDRGVRPGRHEAMPIASEAARRWKLDVSIQSPEVLALVGADLHPVSGPDVKGGTLVIANGKIAAVGGPETAVPAGARTIEMHGLDLWPGLVDAGSNTALSEVGSLSETHDYADAAQFQPELRAAVALKADSAHIPITRANGILTAYVQPSGGIISGQGCAIDLQGWTPRELVIADRVALQVTIPNHIPRRDEASRPGPEGGGRDSGRAEARKRRQEQLDRLKEQFRTALRYDAARSAAKTGSGEPPAADPRLEALVPYAKGERPVIFRAVGRNEILDALAIIKELKLKGVLSDAWDAWKVADAIQGANVPVLVAGTLYSPPDEHDPYDAPYSNPARLHAAGVTVAIRSNSRGTSEATSSRNLPFEAATAVAFGLPEAEALRAITLNPAEVLGIADQVGSLEVGKRANIVVTAGNILQPTTPVVGLFIDGEPVAPVSRQTELADKYRGRLEAIESRRLSVKTEIEPGPEQAGPGRRPETNRTN
jgi:imidazolonepropionase-like amidohydrolase